MSFGMQILNASGVVVLDTTKYGGVFIDSFVQSFVGPSVPITKIYTLPTGATEVKFMFSPGPTNIYRSDQMTVSISYSGSVATLIFTSQIGVQLGINIWAI